VDPREFRPRLHGRLERLAIFDLRLTCRTGLHIGAGKSNDFGGSDQPIRRDAAGRPLVPGSSLRGILRTGVEGVCATLGLDAFSREIGDASDLLPEEAALLPQWRRLTVSQRLFGVAATAREGFSYASRLQIGDAACEGAVVVELRDGVGIARDSRTAAPGIKFDLEVVPAGTTFRGSIRFKNPADYELGLLAQALWMLGSGALLLGGKAARGLGWVGVEVTAPRLFDALEILGRPPAPPAGGDFGPVEERLAPWLTFVEELADTVRASRP
jgi:CRISPR-associated RAMP protein (TIGR02581 family)